MSSAFAVIAGLGTLVAAYAQRGSDVPSIVLTLVLLVPPFFIAGHVFYSLLAVLSFAYNIARVPLADIPFLDPCRRQVSVLTDHAINVTLITLAIYTGLVMAVTLGPVCEFISIDPVVDRVSPNTGHNNRILCDSDSSASARDQTEALRVIHARRRLVV